MRLAGGTFIGLVENRALVSMAGAGKNFECVGNQPGHQDALSCEAPAAGTSVLGARKQTEQERGWAPRAV